MYLGTALFPKYEFHRYRRKHPHRFTNVIKRPLTGFNPLWFIGISYSGLIERVNKRRKVCLKLPKKQKHKQWKL